VFCGCVCVSVKMNGHDDVCICVGVVPSSDAVLPCVCAEGCACVVCVGCGCACVVCVVCGCVCGVRGLWVCVWCACFVGAYVCPGAYMGMFVCICVSVVPCSDAVLPSICAEAFVGVCAGV